MLIYFFQFFKLDWLKTQEINNLFPRQLISYFFLFLIKEDYPRSFISIHQFLAFKYINLLNTLFIFSTSIFFQFMNLYFFAVFLKLKGLGYSTLSTWHYNYLFSNMQPFIALAAIRATSGILNLTKAYPLLRAVALLLATLTPSISPY